MTPARFLTLGTGIWIALCAGAVCHERAAHAEPACAVYTITGYVRTEFSDYTADGTPILTDEPIAASGYDLPFGAMVDVDGLGIFRIADRGLLGPRHLDIAVWSRAEAYAITGRYRACVASE